MNRKKLLETVQKELTICLPEDKKYGIFFNNMIQFGGKKCIINIIKMED